MRREIRKLEDRLRRNPSSETAFLEFLEQYDMNEVMNTMRSLLLIKTGNTIDNRNQMKSLINYNLSLIDDKDKEEEKIKQSKLKIYYFVPMFTTSALMCCYFLTMFITIFNGMMAI